jgi:hypothetical protein
VRRSLDQANQAVADQRSRSLLPAILISLHLSVFISLFVGKFVTLPLVKMGGGKGEISRGDGDFASAPNQQRRIIDDVAQDIQYLAAISRDKVRAVEQTPSSAK